MKYSVKELAKITQATLQGNENLIIEQIIFDSRLIFSSVNNAFIALQTDKKSGEDYIKEAINKGIKVIICQHPIPEIKEITWLKTPDTLLFLRKLAQYHLQQLSLKTIGITGSNGKTIVKEWLYQCLWNEMKVVKSPKSFNSQLGLPLSILKAYSTDELGIFEVGISKPLEMQKQAEILSPEIGIFTHLGTAHSENFENQEEILEEKLQLFKNSKTIIYNGDSKITSKKIKELYPDKKLISYGLNKHNDILLEGDISQKEDFKIKINHQDYLEIPFTHRDNATFHNALAVIATLHELGISKEKILEKINNIRAVEMRMESVKGQRDNLIINDSYNLDLDSLKIALSTLQQYNNKAKKVLVLTDILDVKEEKDNLYTTVAQLVNEQKFNKIYLIGEEIVKYKNLFNTTTFTFDNIELLIKNKEFREINNSVILLKGARKFELESLIKELELQSHDTVLEVNLNAILHNIKVHKSFLKPETKMMAMVKAFSYGLGGYEIAEFLQHHNIDYLTVAYADEGAELRKNNITLPIMVMNPELNSYDTIIDFQLEPEIYSFKVLGLFIDSLKRKGIHEAYPIHIKLETGMHRLGFVKEDLDELLKIIHENNLRIASIFTHLSCADDPNEEEYTLGQIKTYTENSDYILSKIDYHPIRHCLNSPGITNYTQYQFDMVRIGIGMIGYTANPKIKPLLQNAVCFKTVITQIAPLHVGESLGYNRRFKAQKETQIATIAVGYADGIPRILSNGKGFVGIRGKLYPIQGNICMDMLMVDIGDAILQEGEEVIIFNGNPSLEKFAEYCQTIPYEVLTSISRRVKRIYIKD